jgi:chemotaxis-related protein WspB
MRAVIWTACQRRYAVETRHIEEVVPVVETRAMDHVDAWVRGLMNYRGRLVPLLDVSALLGAAPVEARRFSRILIVRADPAEETTRFGLLVERMVGIDELQCGDESSHPGFATAETEYLGPVALLGGESVQIVEPQKMLLPEHREVLFRRSTAGDQ